MRDGVREERRAPRSVRGACLHRPRVRARGALLLGVLSVRSDLVATGASHTAAGETWASLYTMGGIALGVIALGLLMPIMMALAARRGASRTVYALTPTRVLSCRVRRGGLAIVKSVEPSHPLDIVRRDRAAGRGTIILYPSRTRAGAMLTIPAIADARGVERLIRATFNP